jgi:hypothetical protein
LKKISLLASAALLFCSSTPAQLPWLGVGHKSSSSINITVDVNWGATTGSTATITSASHTLTVPGGSTGVVKLAVVNNGGVSRTVKYSLAGGAFTTFTNGNTITAANGNTLQFEMISSASGDEMDITVTDNVTSSAIGDSELIHL